MYNSQEIAKQIKSRVKTCNTTMKVMLTDLGLGINIVSHLAKGQEMSYLNLAKIADYLDCSVDYLLGRTDNPNVNGNNINTGNIGNNNNSSVNINSEKNTKINDFDSTTIQIAEAFQDLDIFEKTEVMNLIAKLSKK